MVSGIRKILWYTDSKDENTQSWRHNRPLSSYFGQSDQTMLCQRKTYLVKCCSSKRMSTTAFFIHIEIFLVENTSLSGKKSSTLGSWGRWLKVVKNLNELLQETQKFAWRSGSWANFKISILERKEFWRKMSAPQLFIEMRKNIVGTEVGWRFGVKKIMNECKMWFAPCRCNQSNHQEEE